MTQTLGGPATNETGGEEEGKGVRLWPLAKMGTPSVVVAVGPLLPVTGFVLPPAGFGAFKTDSSLPYCS